MTRRSESVTFVRDEKQKDTKKAYCQTCLDKDGKLNRLVPRLENGIESDKWKICSYCSELVPIYDVKYHTDYEAKGFISDNPHNSSGTRVIAMRNKRTNKANKVEGIEKIQIDKLGGKEDIELQEMLSSKSRPTILLTISDTIVEEEGY